MTRLTGITQAMLRTEQPMSMVLLDWVDIVVAEVSDATCTTHFPGMTTVTLCLVPFAYKKIVGSDIEGTFIFFNFAYSSIHGELPLQTALSSPRQQLRQWVQQKRAHIRKTP